MDRRLDPRSALPLYQQLADILTAQIDAGALSTGDKIPSENDMAQRYRLGRPTVRQATEVLVRSGHLERRRGSGTFVRQRLPEVDLFALDGTMAAFERTGVELHTELLRAPEAIVVPEDDISPFAGEEAFRIERLGRTGDTAVLLEIFDLAVDAFPGLDQLAAAGGSLSELVVREYGLQPRTSHQSFQAVLPAEGIAAALDVGAGQPLLLVRRTLDFPDHPGAVFAQMYCVTDEFVFGQHIPEAGF